MATPLTFATDANGFMPQGMGQMLLVIMVVGVGVLLTISIRAKIARKNAERPTGREQIDALKASSMARMDADAIQASMHDFARQLAAQLDNKAERLEQLIVQAEDRIAKLTAHESQANGAIRRTENPKPVSVSPSSVEKREPEEAPTNGSRTHAASERLRSNSEPADSLRRAIYALADSGRSPLDIARELDEHIGKVELILALRNG